MNYKNTYKLLLMGGLAPIKLEVCADGVKINENGVYIFRLDGKICAYYPIATTIIQDIEPNPSYVAPPEPEPEALNVNMADLLRRMRDHR